MLKYGTMVRITGGKNAVGETGKVIKVVRGPRTNIPMLYKVSMGNSSFEQYDPSTKYYFYADEIEVIDDGTL